MNNFSLKESLIKLKNKNYDKAINESLNSLVERFDENELRILSQNRGIRLDRIINLFFVEGVGFRCYNDKDNIYGKLPICQNIEKYMNKLYLEHYKNQS